MPLPQLHIRHLTSRLPVIQAGMGVRVGNATLAAAAIRAGGFGTIASVGLGDIEASKHDFINESNRELIAELRRARELTNGQGPLGINVMVALSNYEEIVRAGVSAGVDFIISGAGLPLPLPGYVGSAEVALIPVISSGRAAEVLVKAWLRKYQRQPDAVIVEGPRCGGHLGFTPEQLANDHSCSLDLLYREVRAVLDRYDCPAPLIAAGEVACRADVEAALAMGYQGVQIGTQLIAAAESGIATASKQVFVNATPDDVVVIRSPVGLPVRVLRTPLVERVLAGKREPFTCPYRCLRTCNPRKAPFCIAKALLATWSGDVEHGLFMTGCNVGAIKNIYPLAEFFRSLEG